MKKITILLLLLCSTICTVVAQPAGYSMGNAINAGFYNSGGAYSDSRNSATGGYTNNYGNAANDVWYKFTINTEATSVVVSLCGSNFDTWLRVLNSSGTEVGSNDDNQEACSGMQSQVTLFNLAPGTYFVDAEGYSNYSGIINFSLSVNISEPMVITYPGPQTFTQGTVINPLYPSISGSQPSSLGQTTFTLAGDGSLGNNNGQGSAARFDTPIGTAVDAAGNVYVADSENEMIRKIDPFGNVTTYAGRLNVKGSEDGPALSATFNHPAAVAVDAAGNVYVADQINHKIRKIAPNGGSVSTLAGTGTAGYQNSPNAMFNSPTGLCVDAGGNVYVADYGNHRIRKITPSGTVTLLAGDGTIGSVDNSIGPFASFKNPMSVALDASSNIWVADRLNYKVRKVTPGGSVSTVAGIGSPGSVDHPTSTLSSFDPPNSVAVDPKTGDVFVADPNNHKIRRIAQSGGVTTFAGALSAGLVDGTGNVVRFNMPYALSFDSKGNIYVADTYNNSIRKVIRQAFSISPQLPEGLVFNEATGVISGTPTVTSPAKNYTITAYNEFVTASYTLSIAVTTPSSSDFYMNWISTVQYDEDGNETGASKEFFDNNGKPLQTQVLDESRGQVLASQPLYDFQDRAVGSTLVAPMNATDFKYKPDFVRNPSGGIYNYTNFDGNPDPASAAYLGKVNNPDAVSNTAIGTLGWYYSNNNSMEPYIAATAYPYSRTEFYNDGTGMGKRGAGVGEALKMGAGHEVTQNAFPVINELNQYLELRNKINAVTPLGAAPALMAGKALQTITSDANGQQMISVTDLAGKTLMTGRADPAGWMTVNNSFTLNTPPNTFKGTIKMGSLVTTSSDENYSGFTIISDQEVKVYKDGGLIYTGKGNAFNLADVSTANSDRIFEIVSIYPFYYYCYEAVWYGSSFQGERTVGPFAPVKEETQTPAWQYFHLPNATAVTISGSYTLYNMQTEQPIVGFTSGNTLAKGYYKVVALTGTNVTVSYSNRYSDLSFNYYNSLNQVVATIAPNGIKAYLTNPSGYANLNSIPFVTTYEYDLRGNMTATTSTEGGRSEFIYREDGKIRFSQNRLQRNKKINVVNGADTETTTPIDNTIKEAFSYTNYDQLGRVTEAGEYAVPLSGTQTFASLKADTNVIKSVSSTGGLTGGTKRFTINNYYDQSTADYLAEMGPLGFAQDPGFLKGNISYTQNANSTTWYNYDDQGRVTWLVKQLTGMTGKKTVNYTYDAKGNITVVDFQKNTPAERFRHHYSYDADGRLVTVKTQRGDDGALLQHAKYYYYLHGPLKRVELGDNLQGLDYVYTADGKLKSINHSSGDPAKDPGKDGYGSSLFLPDAFSMQSEYYPNDYSRSGSNISSINTGQTNYYNGNINGISWQSKKPATITGLNAPTMYAYSYDDKYQLSAATWGTPNFTTNAFAASSNNMFQEKGLQYDANGNIKSLQRTNAGGTLSDNFLNAFQYQTNTNKLTSVTGYATYTYDELGQLKSETKGGNTRYVKYDVTGKIIGVYSDQAMTTALITYTYDESGNRIKTSSANGTTYQVYDGIGNVLATYIGSTGSSLSDVPIYGAERLGMYTLTGATTGDYAYEMRDNVGSVRVVINRERIGGQLDVKRYNDYYPFGSVARQGGADYKYEYQGLYAEKDPITGWNNFDLRMYDGRIGRFLSVDPEGQFYSPYVGMGNNPVSGYDPSGGYCDGCGDISIYAEGGWTVDKYGANWRKVDGKWQYQNGLPNKVAESMYWGVKDHGFSSAYAPAIKEWSQSWVGFQSGYNKHDGLLQASKTSLELVAIGLQPGMAGEIAAEYAFENALARRAFKMRTLSFASNDAAKVVSELSPFELEITHGLTKSKNAFQKLKADIAQNGITETIKFVIYKNIRYVVDGHHRLRAAKELGMAAVPIEEVYLPYAGYKTIEDLIYSTF